MTSETVVSMILFAGVLLLVWNTWRHVSRGEFFDSPDKKTVLFVEEGAAERVFTTERETPGDRPAAEVLAADGDREAQSWVGDIPLESTSREKSGVPGRKQDAPGHTSTAADGGPQSADTNGQKAGDKKEAALEGD